MINTVTFYRTHTENRKYALALAFSIDEINRNPDLLPNMSLLFVFSEYNCYSEHIFNNIIHWSLKNHDFLPNFMCEEFPKCVMALTSLNWTTTVKFNIILNNFISWQVSHEIISVGVNMKHTIHRLDVTSTFPYMKYRLGRK